VTELLSQGEQRALSSSVHVEGGAEMLDALGADNFASGRNVVGVLISHDGPTGMVAKGYPGAVTPGRWNIVPG